jgi:hypothetical protein
MPHFEDEGYEEEGYDEEGYEEEGYEEEGEGDFIEGNNTEVDNGTGTKVHSSSPPSPLSPPSFPSSSSSSPSSSLTVPKMPSSNDGNVLFACWLLHLVLRSPDGIKWFTSNGGKGASFTLLTVRTHVIY